jgi:hypothetical protein
MLDLIPEGATRLPDDFGEKAEEILQGANGATKESIDEITDFSRKHKAFWQ